MSWGFPPSVGHPGCWDSVEHVKIQMQKDPESRDGMAKGTLLNYEVRCLLWADEHSAGN